MVTNAATLQIKGKSFGHLIKPCLLTLHLVVTLILCGLRYQNDFDVLCKSLVACRAWDYSNFRWRWVALIVVKPIVFFNLQIFVVRQIDQHWFPCSNGVAGVAKVIASPHLMICSTLSSATMHLLQFLLQPFELLLAAYK